MRPIIGLLSTLCLFVYLYSSGHRVSSLDLTDPGLVDKLLEPIDSLSAEELETHPTVTLTPRERLRIVYTSYIGVMEEGGKGRGSEVERFLRTTNTSAGLDWCAAFAKTCTDEAGIPTPGANAWSPTWFPRERLTKRPQQGDVFSTFSARANRINHVGFVDEIKENRVVTVEGNVRNGNQLTGVHRLYRNPKQIHSYANWIDG
jgi:hypothetical protein